MNELRTAGVVRASESRPYPTISVGLWLPSLPLARGRRRERGLRVFKRLHHDGRTTDNDIPTTEKAGEVSQDRVINHLILYGDILTHHGYFHRSSLIMLDTPRSTGYGTTFLVLTTEDVLHAPPCLLSSSLDPCC